MPLYSLSKEDSLSQSKPDFFNHLLKGQDVNPLISEVFKEMPANFRMVYLLILGSYRILDKQDYQPFMVVITGPSGCGKTSLLNLFKGKKFLHIDTLTPAAFASHFAFKKREVLQKKVDLIPKMRGKIVLYKDLSSVFADYKKSRELLSSYTRILDGDSFTKATGVHSPTIYVNTRHISFGAVTSVNRRAFRLISEIGPRTFFIRMDEGEKIANFKELMNRLENKTKELLKQIPLLPVKEIDEKNKKRIEKLSLLLSVFRSLQPKSEAPHRINAIFDNIFQAAESILKGSGLLLLKKLVQESLPQERFDALCDLIQHGRLTGSYSFHRIPRIYSLKKRGELQKFLKESEVLSASGRLSNQWVWLRDFKFIELWNDEI